MDRLTGRVTASEVAQALDLRPHREGGFFRETYRSALAVSTRYGRRSLATSILYLLTSGSPSRFHRLRADEVWFYHAGGRAELAMLATDIREAPEREERPSEGTPQPERPPGLSEVGGGLHLRLLGPEEPQVFVPRGWWLAARVAWGRQSAQRTEVVGEETEVYEKTGDEPDWTLVGCVVTPGFDYDDFELAERESLLTEFPEAADIIKGLT